jgi:predicted ATP-grasp superfamily ATP-dependent carboligase
LTNPAAIVLGGLANAVSVARSLATQDIPVYALGRGKWAGVQYSRSIREFFRAPDDDPQPAWLGWLEQEAPRLQGAVLLPCEDDALELIARNRGRLVAWGYRPFEADDDVVLAMLDKGQTYALARKLGVPCPRTVSLHDEKNAAVATADLAYPFALKPLHSHRYAGGKAVVVNDRDELERTLLELAEAGVEMLATEIIPGPNDLLFSYYTYIDEQGAPLFHMTKRKLRQYPVGFGAASYGVTQWDEEVASEALRFFLGSGVRGLAEAEFKRDPRDGVVKLIECNHRFTGSNELVRRAGIDLALLTYNRALGRPDPPFDSYRDRVYLWGPILDRRAFSALHRRGELSIWQWLRSLLHRQHFPVFRWSDPRPTIVDVAMRARLVLGKRRG